VDGRVKPGHDVERAERDLERPLSGTFGPNPTDLQRGGNGLNRNEDNAMSLQIRRVVTGHAADGRAVVKIDAIAKNVISNRPGASSCVVWSTKGFPVNNDGDLDPSAASIGTTIEHGTVFRIVRYEPGVSPRNHRTDSIDYAVVISGQIDMELDDDVVVTLKAGDVLVQRGTIHNWVNRTQEDCVIAFVLISADPVEVAGHSLHAVG